MTGPLRLTAVLLVGALLSSCGVSAQEEPHSVELPRRPLTESRSTAAPGDPVGDVAEVLCLVRDDRLVQIVRRVAGSSTPQQHLDHLLAGPTDIERNRGLSTALAGTALKVRVDGGAEAQVEMSEADETSARSDETIAYAQVVCTLTSRADVASVILFRDGDRLEVPRADGSLSRGPLYAGDYIALVVPS